MADEPQLPLAGSYQTVEVDRDGFLELERRQGAGEIKMTALKAPGKSDRWLWRVTYEFLKTPR